MKILLLVTTVVLLACSSSPKPSDPDALGKKIFELLKAGDRESILDYLISKSELKQVFKKSPNWAKMTGSQQDEMVEAAHGNMKRDISLMLDSYTNEKYPDTKALRTGEYQGSAFEEYPDNGATVTHIKTRFIAHDKNYILYLKAANLDTYWKLIGWIEVKEN